MGNYTTLIMIALMVVAFYFLILRPQKRRQQAIQQTLNALAPGDRVLTGGGIFATIVSIGDKQTVLETAPGVELTVLKQAIARKVTPADEDAEYEGLDDELETDVVAEPEGVSDPDVLVPPAVAPEQPRSAGADTSRLG
ncbi:preprotein translocase subunit YajC [uncultured Friedmanniella sp.]|uniref:preprotein translocase subunit YajC n=1 Tax=uncultured Friedmanniella sp. TaxID=335381 RepID=UPI0035CA1DC2